MNVGSKNNHTKSMFIIEIRHFLEALMRRSSILTRDYYDMTPPPPARLGALCYSPHTNNENLTRNVYNLNAAFVDGQRRLAVGEKTLYYGN